MSLESLETEKQTKQAQDLYGAAYNVDDLLTTRLPYRFVRLNPRFDSEETLLKLKSEVDCDPYPVAVPWLDGFYALPGDFCLQQSETFQTARIYGQDVSSGAAVAALMTETYDCRHDDDDDKPRAAPDTAEQASLRALDLCCCPGLKLCAIADTLKQQGREKHAVVVGVDVSEQRMAVCKRIVHKYQIQSSEVGSTESKANSNQCADTVRIRLYCNDGTTFASLPPEELNLVFDSVVASEEDAARLGKRKRMNKSARAREQKRLKDTSSFDTEPLLSATDSKTCSVAGVRLQLFDRVLVDAECSTDGSVIHIQKRFANAQQRSESPPGTQQKRIKTSQWTSDEQLSKLVDLQRKLAATGFRLLKQGGYMVYSTCSLSEDQNEGVVRWLLGDFPNARIVPVDFSRGTTSDTPDSSDLTREGTIPGTIQFLPNLSPNTGAVDHGRLYGGGFFLAKIVKSYEAI